MTEAAGLTLMKAKILGVDFPGGEFSKGWTILGMNYPRDESSYLSKMRMSFPGVSLLGVELSANRIKVVTFNSQTNYENFQAFHKLPKRLKLPYMNSSDPRKVNVKTY